jgi:hypothetical protein
MSRIQDILHMNGRKYDLIFGFILLFGSPLIITGRDIVMNPGLTATFGFVIYIIEAWAFRYKVISVRWRAIDHLMAKNRSSANLPQLTVVITLARYAHTILRLIVFVISLRAALKAIYFDDELYSELIPIVALSLALSFDIMLFRNVYFDSNAAGIKKRSDSDSTRSSELSIPEKEWRKNFQRFTERPGHLYKELTADFILIVTGLMFAHSYWSSSMKFFLQGIENAHAEGVGAGSILWTLLFVSSLTAFLVVFPSRLTYWVEENWNDLDSRRKKIRWSMVFAFAGLTVPLYFHFIRVYFF